MKDYINSHCKILFQGKGAFWTSEFSLRESVHAYFCPCLPPQIFGKCLGMKDTEADT